MSDGSGTLQARYDYDPYGRVTKLSGSLDSDFQYCRYYQHSSSGLGLTMYRGYVADSGQWLSRDPLPDVEINQGPNLYQYVRNNPITLVDREGLLPSHKSGPPTPRIGTSEHTNVLIFSVSCPAGQSVTNVTLVYDFTLHGYAALLDDGRGPGGFPPDPIKGVNCTGEPVQVFGYMRTRYAWTGHANEYVAGTRVYWDCQCCKK